MATTLEDEHRLIEGVLNQLEAMADALPALPPVSAIDGIVLHLRESLPAHCRHEELALAATMATSTAPDDDGDLRREMRARALEILQDEHTANEAIAHELADALEECVAAGAATGPEALGQLARQFFMLMRRHIAWEEFILSKLTPARG